MNKSSLILVLLFVFSNSQGQNSIEVKREYRNDEPETFFDSLMNKTPNTISISLDEGFDDSLFITVNDSIYINGCLKPNLSIGYAGGLSVTFKDSSEIKILKLKFVRQNFIIEERLDFRYKALQVRKLGSWLLLYRNTFPVRE